MSFPWMLFVDLGIVSAALLIATLLRARTGFLQKFLIPNSLTAGFLLLVFYNFAGPPLGLTPVNLRSLAYHLLNISFVAVSLRKPLKSGKRAGSGPMGIALGLLTHYGLQATIGLALTSLLAATIAPNIFAGFGLLLPLGFSAGPGQAYSIGQGWQRFGIEGAGSVGLTFAAVGFLWACFGGVYLINYGIRHGWINEGQAERFRNGHRNGFPAPGTPLIAGARPTTESDAIDSRTYHTAFILLSYFLTFLLLTGITKLLSFAGDTGMDLASSLWGIAFIFCSLVARLVRRVVDAAGVAHSLDDAGLTRMAGLSVDLMVACALGSISLVIVTQFWIPILIISTLAGILALVLVPWMAARVFKSHQFGCTLIVYGAATGTLATGMALLRVIDPELKSPVAMDYMKAAGIVFLLAIPLILVINLPAYSVIHDNPVYLIVAFAVCVGYIVLCGTLYLMIRKRNGLRGPISLWGLHADTAPSESPEGYDRIAR